VSQIMPHEFHYISAFFQHRDHAEERVSHTCVIPVFNFQAGALNLSPSIVSPERIGLISAVMIVEGKPRRFAFAGLMHGSSYSCGPFWSMDANANLTSRAGYGSVVNDRQCFRCCVLALALQNGFNRIRGRGLLSQLCGGRRFNCLASECLQMIPPRMHLCVGRMRAACGE